MGSGQTSMRGGPGPPRRGGLDLGHMLRALKHRNYALFFVGQGISVIGTWMQHAAMLWLVYRITGRRSAPGELAFYSLLPSLLLFPVAGVIGDRFNRRVLVIVLQALSAVQALVLSWVVLSGAVRFWHLVGLGMFAGLIRSFEIPIRQSLVVQMLEDRNDLPGAIALNSFLMNGAFVIGPSLAGLLIHAFSHLEGRQEGPCFLINGISYLTVIAALLAMKLKPGSHTPNRQHPLRSFVEGLKYTAAHKPIRRSILLLAFAALVGMQYTTLMPVFAKDVLRGDSRTQGYLLSAAGAGAMLGALFLASQRGPEALHRLMPLGVTIFGLALISLALAPSLAVFLQDSRLGEWVGSWLARRGWAVPPHALALWLSMGVLLIGGVGRMIEMASANTYVQTLVDDDKRSRVMAFHASAFMGIAPLGSLLLGLLAETRLHAVGAMLLAGTGCLLGAAAFAGRLPPVREHIEALARPDEPENLPAGR